MIDPNQSVDEILGLSEEETEDLDSWLHSVAGPQAAEGESPEAEEDHREWRHPATRHMLQFFTYDHLPPHLQDISRPVCELAKSMVEMIEDGPELTVGLRFLLQGKDALVRAALLNTPPSD